MVDRRQPAPLTIACPAVQIGHSPDGNPVPMTWPSAVTTGGKPPVKVRYTPPQGSLFPVGTTQVQATATSKDGQVTNCFFPVQIVQDSPSPVVGPTAAASVSPTSIQPGQSVTLNTTGTHQGTGALATWVVNWGSGANSSGTGIPPITLTHTYAVAGSFAPVLSVTDVNGKGNAATAQTVVVAVALPLAPSNLTGQQTGPTQVTLNWQDNASNETGNKVERRISPAAFAEIATTPVNTPTYQDPTVTPPNTYDYRVRAFNATGDSAYSNIATVQVGAVAFDFFVDGASGQDAPNTTGSFAQPFRTLTYAVPFLSAGKTLGVRGGTYAEDALFKTIPTGLDDARRVRIANYNGEVVWYTPPASALNAIGFGKMGSVQQVYISIDGINVDGQHVQFDIVKINFGDGEYAHHINLTNLRIRGRHDSPNRSQGLIATGQLTSNDPPGTIVVGSNIFRNVIIDRVGKDKFDQATYIQSPNNVLDHIEVFDHIAGGIEVFNQAHGAVVPTGNVLSNIIVHDSYHPDNNQDHRAILIAGDNTLVYNFLVYNIPNGGLFGTNDNLAVVAYGGNGIKFFNGTVYNTVNALCASYDFPTPNVQFRNCIAYNNFRNYYPRAGEGVGLVHDFCTDDGTDPLFVNAAAGDFRLQDASPARNTGVTLAEFTTDLNDVLRPQGPAWDRGVYERA